MKEECAKHIDKLSYIGLKYGKLLEDKHGMDLTGYYKIFFNDSKHRIIYGENTRNEIEVIEIIVIGKREGFDVYKEAFNRIDHN